MRFHMLIDITNMDSADAGPLLPTIFKSKIPPDCERLSVLDYHLQKYNIDLHTADDDSVWLCGSGWATFLESIAGRTTKTLRFELIRDHRFVVSAFTPEGLEICHFNNRPSFVCPCLVNVTQSIFHHQDLPRRFLEVLTERTSAREWKTARVSGPKHSANVRVTDVPTEGYTYGVASGSEGSQWTTFCFENEIEEGYTLKFTNSGILPDYGQTFSVNIFNSNGLEFYNNPETACSRYTHIHCPDLPVFYLRLANHSITTNMLTLPPNFVRTHRVYEYNVAVLSFGNVVYYASLHVKEDERVPGDYTHIYMLMDWEAFIRETGLFNTKRLHFEMHPENNIAGEVIYFDIC